jgi:hypothetical protein
MMIFNNFFTYLSVNQRDIFHTFQLSEPLVNINPLFGWQIRFILPVINSFHALFFIFLSKHPKNSPKQAGAALKRQITLPAPPNALYGRFYGVLVDVTV